MKFKIFILLSMIFLCGKLFSQEIPAIITDRPDVTESSFTIPENSLQIESGFSFTSNKYNFQTLINDSLITIQNTEEYLVTPTVLLRYGISKKTELRLGAQLTTSKSKSESADYTESVSTNLEGVNLAAKFKIADQNKILPSTAIIVGSTFPAINPGIETDVFDPSLIFVFSNQISDIFGVGYNLGIYLPDGFDSTASGSYSVSFAYSLAKNAGVFAEAYGTIPFSSVNASNYLDGGVTVLLKKNIQLDFSGGIGLNSDVTEIFVNTGISFRFPK